MRQNVWIWLLGWLVIPAAAQNYLWPTNASPFLSSSFCEYRPGHFHSAIDIKTWNREGYPCYAVEDGVVERVRISVFGGGKALYLRLKDGRIAVYFHLQRFISPLEKMIFNRQIKKERYAVEIWPRDFKVKKGQVIAYTGQTGIGVPHLHFEIRDKKNVPLNPLRFYPQVKDTRPPVLKQLAVIPLDAASAVNGFHAPLILKLKKQNGRAVYTVTDSIRITGRVGLALSGYDLADGVYNKLAFYRTALYEGKRLLFAQSFDRMPFSKTKQVEIFIHRPLKSSGSGRFQKLYIDPYNTLPVYAENGGDGVITVDHHSRDVRIEAADFKGNLSTVKLHIAPAPSAADIYRITAYNDALYLDTQLPKHIKKVRFYTGMDKGKLIKAEHFELSSQAGGHTVARIPYRTGRDKRVAIETRDANGVFRRALPLFNKAHPRIRILHRVKWLQLTGENFYQPASVDIVNIRRHKSVPLPLGRRSESILSAADLVSGPLNITVRTDSAVVSDTSLYVLPLVPGRADSASFWNNRFGIRVTEQSVYDTLLFTLQRAPTDSRRYKTPVDGYMYRLDNGGEALRSPVTIEIQTDSSLAGHNPLHVYGIRRNGLAFMGGESIAPNRLRIKLSSPGTLVVAADTAAPEIAWLTPADSSSFNSKSMIRFTAVDSLSGIGTERNIHVYWDSLFVLPEWDFENNTISAKLHFKPQPGTHRIYVDIYDRAGNHTRKTRTVFVK